MQAWLAVGQSAGVSVGTLTSPVGVGAGIGPWKPDVQLPIPEKTEATLYMAPYTIYRPKIDFHTKGEQLGATAWCTIYVQQRLQEHRSPLSAAQTSQVADSA